MPTLMERFEFVGLHWRLVFMQMGEGILSTIVVRIIVSIDCLRFQPSNRVKLLLLQGGCVNVASD